MLCKDFCRSMARNGVKNCEKVFYIPKLCGIIDIINAGSECHEAPGVGAGIIVEKERLL